MPDEYCDHRWFTPEVHACDSPPQHFGKHHCGICGKSILNVNQPWSPSTVKPPNELEKLRILNNVRHTALDLIENVFNDGNMPREISRILQQCKETIETYERLWANERA